MSARALARRHHSHSITRTGSFLPVGLLSPLSTRPCNAPQQETKKPRRGPAVIIEAIEKDEDEDADEDEDEDDGDDDADEESEEEEMDEEDDDEPTPQEMPKKNSQQQTRTAAPKVGNKQAAAAAAAPPPRRTSAGGDGGKNLDMSAILELARKRQSLPLEKLSREERAASKIMMIDPVAVISHFDDKGWILSQGASTYDFDLKTWFTRNPTVVRRYADVVIFKDGAIPAQCVRVRQGPSATPPIPRAAVAKPA